MLTFDARGAECAIRPSALRPSAGARTPSCALKLPKSENKMILNRKTFHWHAKCFQDEVQ